jgi:putative acetyltransferase
VEPDALLIAEDDPRAPDVRAVLERHLSFTAGESPPEDVHALGVDALAEADLVLVSCRDAAGTVLGVGAVTWLGDGHAELKSMHTAVEARGRGVGTALLAHLLDLARDRGCTRVSLETGTMDSFAPARALYSRAGFEPCPPFGSYWVSPHSVCMTRTL